MSSGTYADVKAWRQRQGKARMRVIRKIETRKWKVKYPKEAKIKSRSDHLRRAYGITQKDFERMTAEQHGLCLVCHRNVGLLHIDHDHKTGKIRGLLCGCCNRALGQLNDDPLRVESLLAYIQSFTDET